jgi:vesicle coat complex subunit
MVANKPRGELSELGATLQNLCVGGKRSDKELRSAKKDAFKKVINYMTLGMDMSSLFPMMISCANLSPDDVVLKKMLYLYITHYAQQTPDLALLTINQLHKDCADQDPTVRGLALRSLCSLRVANFLEYVMQPINTGLEDRHPYVRRTAVLGVLKVQHIDPQVVANQGLLDKVRHLMYHDTDAQVISNCLVVITSVEDVSKLASDRVLVYNLINRMKEFSDWSQCQVRAHQYAY